VARVSGLFRLRFLVLVCALAGSALVAPAPAGAFFSSVGTLSPAGVGAFSNQVAIDPDGNAIFVWANGGNDRIQARFRAAGGALSPVQNISGTDGDALSPQVVMDPQGRALIVWKEFEGSDQSIKVRRRSAAGTLGTIQTLSGASDAVDFPAIAVDSDGNSITIWRSFDGADYRVRLRRRAVDGTLGQIETFGPAGGIVFNPHIAMQPNGAAVGVWERSDGTDIRIQTRRRTAAGGLGSLANLSAAGQNASNPQLDLESDGDADFVWTRSDGSDPRVQTRRRTPDGLMAATQTLSTAGEDGRNPQVAVEPGGNAHFTWALGPGSFVDCCTVIQVRRKAPGGTLSPVETISRLDRSSFIPQVAVDDAGNAVFTWQLFDQSQTDPFDMCCTRAQVRKRSPATGYGGIQTLSDAGQNARFPHVAMNAGGDAAAAWERLDGSDPDPFDPCCSRVQGAVGP
jgi:hypothetical protein